MWPNPQFPADLVTFTEEILNGKLHFLCSGYSNTNNKDPETITLLSQEDVFDECIETLKTSCKTVHKNVLKIHHNNVKWSQIDPLRKKCPIWSFSDPHFPGFGLNTERYFVSPSIQSECGKIRTRNSKYGHFSRSDLQATLKELYDLTYIVQNGNVQKMAHNEISSFIGTVEVFLQKQQRLIITRQ